MEHENLDDIMPDDFGISSTEQISAEDLSELILGGDITSDPNDVTSASEPQAPKTPEAPKAEPKKEKTAKAEEISEDELEDSILGKKEEEDSKDKESNDDESQEDDKESDFNPFESLAKDLVDLGMWELEEGETAPNSPEDFKEKWVKENSKQINFQIQNFISQKHGDEGMDMFKAIFVNGVPPQEYLERYTKIESLSNLDISNESNQEKVYRTYYKQLEWEDEDIEENLQKLKDYGDLSDTTEKLHKKLIAQEQKDLQILEQQKVAQQKALSQQRDAHNQTIAQIISEKLKERNFDGIPLTDKIANEAYDELTTGRYRLPSGELITEFDNWVLNLRRPENFELKAKLWLLNKSGFDFSKIKQKAISEKESAMFHNLVQKEKTVKRVNKQPVNDSFASFLS